MQADGDIEAADDHVESSREERREKRRERRRRRTRRFIEQYERRREMRQAGHGSPWSRPIRITTGVLLLLGGVAIGWLPGPGFVILAVPGAFLIASEWRRAAIIMDHLENVTVPRMLRFHARLRGGPKPEWVAHDPEYWAGWCEARGIDLPEALESSEPAKPHAASDSDPEETAAG